jgi:hypothetical protein
MCTASCQFGQTLESSIHQQPIDRTEGRSFECGPLQDGELMPERENFGRELEPTADRGAQRGKQDDEQQSHPARGRY